ncbi:MAG TPA: redoxin domain-containing protein [Bacteroidales bacterium]|nr:redoxin domain-containing protein [Bacteroidales bacterium]HRX96261.1 redoxin domain-containing protein [Bacteroidales bacterium]
MRFIQILLFFIFAIPVLTIGQNHTLSLQIENMPSGEIYLADFYGDKNTYVDTALIDESGNAVFEMKKDLQPGLFRVLLNQNMFFDIIYNNEDIAIATDAQDLYEGLVIEKSEENKIYYDFLRKMNDYNRKFDLLSPINDYYPRNDTFFIIGRQEFILVQAELIAWMEKTVQEHPAMWVSKIMKQRKPLYFDPSLTEPGRREYAVEHFFDNVDFTDVDLLRSNVYTSMAIEYISLYGNPNFTQEQLQKEFIKAVDKIMYKAMDNSIVYQFIVEYLVGGFEKYHFDLVLDYIAENYAPEQCENENAVSDLETRLKKYALLSVGKQAPEIEIADSEGKPVSLYEIKSKYTLLIFWSSTCPHCVQTLPEIEKLYNSSLQSKDLTIFTVSLDTEEAAWKEALKGNYLDWINTCSFKGWNTKAAVDYNVYATPTMFLLDKEKKILAKPITLNELKGALMQENLLQ